VKVRGTEFDEVMIKLFIEKAIERLGDNDPHSTVKIMEDIAFDGKDILVENEGMMKVDEVIEENKRIMEKYIILEKENKDLSDEIEYYLNKVIEYEHTLSKFRLDELIDEDDYYEAENATENEDDGIEDENENEIGWHRMVYGTTNTTDGMIRSIETGS
jgi:hypothetical protein